MTLRVGLSKDTARLIRNAKIALTGEALSNEVVKFFGREAAGVVRTIVTEHLVGGVTTSTTRRRRSGELARSLRGTGLVDDGFPSIQVGSFGLAYARAQLGDEDTIITPKRGKALTIPLAPALTPTGRLKGGKGARDYGDQLQFVPFKRTGANIFGALYFKKDLKAAQKKAQAAAVSRVAGEAGVSKNTRGVASIARKEAKVDLGQLSAVFLLARRTKIKATGILRKGFTAQVPGLADRLGNFLGQELLRRLAV